MDFIKNAASSLGQGQGNQQQPQAGNVEGQQQAGAGGGGFMDKLNSMGGGGAQGEANEDYLDKGVDFVQQRMGGGDQSNENAIEQQKDEAISDQIRSQYKSMTGSDFPVADK